MAFLSTKLAFVTMVTWALVVMTNGFVVKIENELKEVFDVEKEFEYFTFVLSWPATYCSLYTKCCEQNACCKGSEAPTQFVIRGLWPEYNNGSRATCCQDKPYNETEISGLLDDLNKYMPNMLCINRTACSDQRRPFLAKVWEKHGTCTYPVFRSQYSYFAQNLDLFYTFNVTAILQEAGYGASSTALHSLEGIASTIEKAFGAKPWITCPSLGHIGDIRLCLHKNFQPRDCAEATTSTCPEKVSLPILIPPGAKTIWTANSRIEKLEAF